MAGYWKGKKLSKETRLKMSKSQSGPNHYAWKGGIWKDRFGYVYVYSPYHPFAKKDRYILRSRLVIEKQLGRFLAKNEVVHHINGVKGDDRPKNLMLFKNNKEHIKFHRKGV